MAKSSKARIRANAKYSKNNYDRFELKVKKGQKEIIINHAKKNGESLNGFIYRSVKDMIEREGGTLDIQPKEESDTDIDDE